MRRRRGLLRVLTPAGLIALLAFLILVIYSVQFLLFSLRYSSAGTHSHTLALPAVRRRPVARQPFNPASKAMTVSHLTFTRAYRVPVPTRRP